MAPLAKSCSYMYYVYLCVCGWGGIVHKKTPSEGVSVTHTHTNHTHSHHNLWACSGTCSTHPEEEEEGDSSLSPSGLSIPDLHVHIIL